MSNDDQRAPEALLPLTPTVLHILLALADGEKHGYAIMQEVEARTGGAKRMLKDGLIVEVQKRSESAHGEERRRYYHLTDFGSRVLQAEARRLEQLVHIAQSKQVLPGFGTMGGV
jgi:DNA-binding PadR family transcriptional regulator